MINYPIGPPEEIEVGDLLADYEDYELGAGGGIRYKVLAVTGCPWGSNCDVQTTHCLGAKLEDQSDGYIFAVCTSLEWPPNSRWSLVEKMNPTPQIEGGW